jgi:hypothetical protein
LTVRRRHAPVPPCPAAHDEIAGVWIACPPLLDSTSDGLREFEIERAGKAARDLALRFGEIAAVSLEAVGENPGRREIGRSRTSISVTTPAAPSAATTSASRAFS